MPDLTDKEVAEELRKHPRTIQRWCIEGRVPGAYKNGRTWAIPASGLAALMGRPRAQKSGIEVARDECAALRVDLVQLGAARRSGKLPPPSAQERDWAAVKADIDAIGESLKGVRAEVDEVDRWVRGSF